MTNRTAKAAEMRTHGHAAGNASARLSAVSHIGTPHIPVSGTCQDLQVTVSRQGDLTMRLQTSREMTIVRFS